MSGRRLGVYICHCGGNISDHLDVEAVRTAVEHVPGVTVSKTTTFACSDATQAEIIDDIKSQQLDGMVIASCSPTLHQLTFRGVAQRAELNPYRYVHVNIREQDSWAHTGDHEGATDKAIRLVRGGIASASLTQDLTPTRVDTVPEVLVVGAGIAGLSAALGLAQLGLGVTVVERATEPGGRVLGLGDMFSSKHPGSKVIESLLERLEVQQRVRLMTKAQLVGKSGTVGDFEVTLEEEGGQQTCLHVGAIVVATGFESYRPAAGELGFGATGVITLPDLLEALDNRDDEADLVVAGRVIKSVAFIYCVGSRNPEGNRYCSRSCCNTALHAAKRLAMCAPEVEQYHLHRGMRSYGKHEVLYEEAARLGAVFLQFDDTERPEVGVSEDGVEVRLTDLLSGRQPMTLSPDLLVLVTGAVPRENEALEKLLKLPRGQDHFYNEIHPKLRPVETLVDGIYLAGTAQGPKDAAESVASSLSAAGKVAALLRRGYVELPPTVAMVDTDRCAWCDACAEVCAYNAVEQREVAGRKVAQINNVLCKGGGACLPVCPEDAIDLLGYTDRQIEAIIDAYIPREEQP